MYRLLAIAALLFLAQGALARDYNWPLWVTTQAEIDALPADADAVAFQPDDESAKYDFSRLKDLRTVHTCRTGIRWFASATGVTKLVILDDDIDDELSALKGWTRLEELEVLRGPLGAGLESLKGCKRLRAIDAPLDDRGAEKLKLFPALEWVTSNGTELGSVGVKRLAEAVSIRHLVLRADMLLPSSLVALAAMPKLETLDLTSADDFDAPMVEQLAGIKGLKRFKLNGRVLDPGALKPLGGHKGIEEIDLLWSKGCTEADIEPLAACPMLRVLKLSINAGLIGDAILPFATHARLETLGLRWAIASRADEAVSGLKCPALRELDITGLRLDPETVAGLADLPSLKVLHLGAGNMAEAHLKRALKLETLEGLEVTTLTAGEETWQGLLQVKTLEWLEVDCAMPAAIVSRLHELSELRHLRMFPEHNLSPEEWASLTTIGKLEWLHAGGPNLTDEVMRAMVEKHPGITFYFGGAPKLTDWLPLQKEYPHSELVGTDG